MAVVFLLIIVLQYGEDKMQRRKLSMSFSNHGPFIKQLNCNFIIREEKKNAVKYHYCLYLWSLNSSISATSLMSKCHEYGHPFLECIPWAQAESMEFNKEDFSCWIQLKA